MKISSINNQTSFRRVIPILTTKNTSSNHPESNIDNSIFELDNVLNSKDSKLYSPDEADKIRGFFKEVLGDYNGESGIKIKKFSKDNTILVSGQDLKYIEKTKSGKNRSSHRRSVINNDIKERIENGKSNKPESVIILDSSDNTKSSSKTKFDSIVYSSLSSSYARIRDDARYELNETGRGNIIKDYICNQQELVIDPA